uniref:Secreted protein n=1 Tax=Streptomyces sp. NBC_01401 TaxID=2903854 RepID=A0AAU3GQD4_9ACTN
MSGANGWTHWRRSGNGLLVAPVWALLLVAAFFCWSPAATAAPHATPSMTATTADTAFTPVPPATASVVVVDSPDERGVGTSCHGTVDHSTAVVLPGHPAPVSLPCPSVALRTAPLTGASVIRGPSNDGVGAVDQLLLQVQRI